MAVPIFEIRDLVHAYNGRPVLFIRHLEFVKGSITGLSGPNGSGKSTLLKLLGFAQKPAAGQILFNGREEAPYSMAVRARVTLLTQEPYLLKRTVFDNIAYGLKIRKQTAGLESDIRNALDLVGLDFKEFARRKWHELSGGEAQRVAMAARLALKPEVLLLDEPTASVDADSANLIRDASLKARDKWGTTLIIASHDRNWLYDIADRQLQVIKGRVFSAGAETIIPGPWEPAGSRTGGSPGLPARAARQLADGQIITAVAPPRTDMTAVLKNSRIRIDAPCSPSDKSTPAGSSTNTLTGIVSLLVLEKKTNRILVTIMVQDLALSLSLDRRTVSSLSLFPGKPVSLSFDAADVQWM